MFRCLGLSCLGLRCLGVEVFRVEVFRVEGLMNSSKLPYSIYSLGLMV